MDKSRGSIDLLTKEKILKEIDNGVEYSIIMSKYKLKSSANVSMIKKRRKEIENALKSSILSPLRKSLKSSPYENIDRGLKNFISNCNNKGRSYI